uniref:Uncharacterized protein n=1 Tax=viral metagenome TaxID=1070528 RepID=A0A6C0J0C2_9ZZZZ
MLVTINTIPNDIIMDMIVLNLELSDISKLILSSKYYYNNKDTIYNTIIANDKFLKNYLNNINLITTINKSSFTFKIFFKMYDNIKNLTYIDRSIPFIDIKKNILLTSDIIDNTFKLYKLLMTFVLYKEKYQFRNFITTHMIKYFRNIYKYRHPGKKDISNKIFFNFITHSDELKWHLLNINIYYLYENGNLIELAKRSYDLKNNLDYFDDGIIDNNYENSIYTLSFLIKMFEYLKNIEIRIYYMYKIFKYTKFILLLNKNFDFRNKNFTRVIKNKIEDFKYKIENDLKSKIPYIIKQKMFIEINELNNLC